MSWRQEQPNELVIQDEDGLLQVIRAGTAAVRGTAIDRTPGGHPGGYLEAFANIYRDFARAMRDDAHSPVPGAAEGPRGMNFVATAVAASSDNLGRVELTA